MAQGIQFPPNYKLAVLQDMAGLNTKAQRPAIDDQQFSWVNNFMPIGKANLRTLWDKGTNLYTATGGKTIIQIFFYNIGSTTYVAVFLSDGSAVQVRLSDGATTTIGGAGTFWSSGTTPHCTQWASSGILIVSQKSADSYWAWDLAAGGTLYSPGDDSPDWLNGGTPTKMPTGVAGTDIETFLNRVWIIDNTNILTSAASNGATFSAGAGGLTKPNTDSSLRIGYTSIKQANGYLYVTGDSSTAYITNVQQSGMTTTYQYTVIDPQIGTPWRDSTIPFGRSVLFANTSGIYAVYGSSVNKISDALDGLWNTQMADFSTVVPSTGVATVFGIKVFCIAVRTTDPTTNAKANFIAMFDGQKWWMASQSVAPIEIAAQEVSSNLQTWGTDGTTIYQCFAAASASLTKVVQSKLWEGEGGFGWITRKQTQRFYTETSPITGAVAMTCQIDTDNGSVSQTIDASQAVTWLNNSSEVVQWQNGSGQDVDWTTNATISYNNSNAYGLLLGFTLTSTTEDFVLERAGLGYIPFTPLY